MSRTVQFIAWYPRTSLMLITIREVAEAELSQLLHLYTHLNPNDPALPLSEAAKIWKSMVQDSNQCIYGAYLEGELVATCELIVIANLTRGGRPYALIENVVTHSECRRRGYATAVLRHALEAAWERSCYKVMLMTGSKNEATLRFYENAGFQRGDKTGFVARPGG